MPTASIAVVAAVPAFAALVKISESEFKHGHFSVSYHALAAALHHAREEMNISHIQQVVRLARRHQAWIDRSYPDDPASTVAANSRGNLPLYENLHRQATTLVRFYELRAVGNKGRTRRRVGPRIVADATATPKQPISLLPASPSE